jgi:hypothetical protein
MSILKSKIFQSYPIPGFKKIHVAALAPVLTPPMLLAKITALFKVCNGSFYGTP